MNEKNDKLITNVESLLHPECLSREQLLEILEVFCIKVSSSAPIENIIDLFNKVALPLPQRVDHKHKSSRQIIINDEKSADNTHSEAKTFIVNSNDLNKTSQTHQESKNTISHDNTSIKNYDSDIMLSESFNNIGICDQTVNNTASPAEKSRKRVLCSLFKGNPKSNKRRKRIEKSWNFKNLPMNR